MPMPAPRIARSNALNRQPQPLYGTVLFERFYGVLRAGGVVAAGGAQHGADGVLVELHR